MGIFKRRSEPEPERHGLLYREPEPERHGILYREPEPEQESRGIFHRSDGEDESE